MLQAVAPPFGQGAVRRAGLLEDVERRVDGRVADRVDAHGESLRRCGHHERAHRLRVHGGPSAVAFEARVRVRLGHPGRVLARHAVEELLEAGHLQHRARVRLPHGLEAPHVGKEGGEEVHARRQLAAGEQRRMDVVADEVEPGMRHERHVAHARHAVLRQLGEKAPVGVGNLGIGEGAHDPRHKLHGGRLAHDARQLAVLEAVVRPSCGRLALARQAQLAQGGRVEPQRVGIARVQGHGARGEGLVERALRGRDGRVPAVLAPSLGEQPARRAALGEALHARHAVGLALSQKRGCKRGRVHGRVEEVQVRVVEARHYERVFEVAHLGSRRVAVRLPCERAHLFARPDGGDAVS